MSRQNLPPGKLPYQLLERVLKSLPVRDADVHLGPGIGLDCAIVEHGNSFLVFKTDPITFVTDSIGWYLVQVNANDIATTGARPRWFLVTLLLPERATNHSMVTAIFEDIKEACSDLDISVIGGHTEITHGLDRPIAIGTLVGEVGKGDLITPRGASPADRLLYTKGVAIELTAILASELPGELSQFLDDAELAEAADYLKSPGLSVLRDAQIALASGKINAMHDPTEGGLAAALWELAQACEKTLVIVPSSVPISALSAKICQAMKINPYAAISSGSLLLSVSPECADDVAAALIDSGIPCANIGWVESGPVAVWQEEAGSRSLVPRPERDEIARIFADHRGSSP